MAADPKEGAEVLPVVAWGIFDSQGFYEGSEEESFAKAFCDRYNARPVDPCKPYTYSALTSHAAATSLIAELQRERDAAYRAGLEAAAKVCESRSDPLWPNEGFRDCAAAIRNLGEG